MELPPPSHPGHWAARAGYLQGMAAVALDFLERGDVEQAARILREARTTLKGQDEAYGRLLTHHLQSLGCPLASGEPPCPSHP